jgi:hypothetical protein
VTWLINRSLSIYRTVAGKCRCILPFPHRYPHLSGSLGTWRGLCTPVDGLGRKPDIENRGRSEPYPTGVTWQPERRMDLCGTSARPPWRKMRHAIPNCSASSSTARTAWPLRPSSGGTGRWSRVFVGAFSLTGRTLKTPSRLFAASPARLCPSRRVIWSATGCPERAVTVDSSERHHPQDGPPKYW